MELELFGLFWVVLGVIGCSLRSPFDPKQPQPPRIFALVDTDRDRHVQGFSRRLLHPSLQRQD